MEWKFKKNSLDNSQIKLIEQELSVKLPIEFVALIKQNNGARPSKNSYDLKNEKGKFFDSLIDYSFEEKNNVVAVYKRLKTDSVNKMIPFGEDGFGNYICFNYVNEENPNVVFYDHEINEVIEMTNSFNEFLDLLY